MKRKTLPLIALVVTVVLVGVATMLQTSIVFAATASGDFGNSQIVNIWAVDDDSAEYNWSADGTQEEIDKLDVSLERVNATVVLDGFYADNKTQAETAANVNLTLTDPNGGQKLSVSDSDWDSVEVTTAGSDYKYDVSKDISTAINITGDWQMTATMCVDDASSPGYC